MRGRDRLFATVTIWIAFAIVMSNMLDRFTQVVTDFSGLWPPLTFYGDTSNPTYDQINELINRTGSQIVSQVDQVVARQMAASMPILVILSLALILAATLSTYFVWRNAHLDVESSGQTRRAGQATAKSKRGSRVEQVVNALNDDEIAELRARLVSEDGAEPVPLEQLLTVPRDHQYRE